MQSGKPAGAVRERGEVGLRLLGAEVQARPREQVRLLERAHPDVAARAEQRVVRADVEVDLVAGGAGRLAIHGLRVDQPWAPERFSSARQR